MVCTLLLRIVKKIASGAKNVDNFTVYNFKKRPKKWGFSYICTF